MNENLENLKNNAKRLINENKFDKLLELLNDSILNINQNEELYVMRAYAHFKLNDFFRGEDFSNRAIEKNKNYREAYLVLGEGMFLKGNLNAAIDNYTIAANLDPKYPLSFKNLGIVFEIKTEYTKAIENFSKAIQLDQKDFDSLCHRGSCWHALSKFNNAIDDFNKSLEINPDNITALNSRGITWEKIEEVENALSDFSRAIEIDPNNSSSFLNRGNIWKIKNQYKEALSDYNKSIELNPKSFDAFNNRGNLYYLVSNFTKAIDNCTIAIGLNPEFPSAYVNRGLAFGMIGKIEEAINDFTKAIEIDPKSYIALNNRGLTYLAISEFKNALNDFSTAISFNPEYPNAFYNRGNCFEKLRSLEYALEDYEKFLELNVNQNNYWSNNARKRIDEIHLKINDPDLGSIIDSINSIKSILQFNPGRITHYTSLTSTKILLIEDNFFRISEASYLNDSSEGKELYKYLQMEDKFENVMSECVNLFSQRPFIGSFVNASECNNLNLWRMYGKENFQEAKGCSITIDSKAFINKIFNKFINTDNRINFEDITFFNVVYITTNDQNRFIIPSFNEKDTKILMENMENLKKKVLKYNNSENKYILESYINSISYLFKSNIYNSEKEIRLVIDGIGFEKKIDTSKFPPLVYIDLANLKTSVTKVIIGPKVERPEEWTTALHYSFEKSNELATDLHNRFEIQEAIPDIIVSRLPFK